MLKIEVGTPANEAQLRHLQGALAWAACYEWELEDALPQAFEPPYGQEDVNVQIFLSTPEEWQAGYAEAYGYPDLQFAELQADFTGWILATDYSDSMTSPWATPLYFNDNGYYTNAM